MNKSAPYIIYEDSALLALAKPAGLHVFGKSSLCSWLCLHRPKLVDIGKPGFSSIVHRLDYQTSGLMLAACTHTSYHALREMFTKKQVEKTYLTLAEGQIKEQIDINDPLGTRYRRSKKVHISRSHYRKLRAVRYARTLIIPIAYSRRATLCEVHIRTGVRHQIRAHLSFVGHPVAGDELYGAKTTVFNGLENKFFLHSYAVRFMHPTQKTPFQLVCPLTDELMDVLAKIRTQLEIANNQLKNL